MSKFKTDDIVKLKPDVTKMTVEKYEEENGEESKMVCCKWTNKEGNLERHIFHEDMLIHNPRNTATVTRMW